MAEGLKTPPLTQMEFTGDDWDHAERIANRYVPTSAVQFICDAVV
jgi:hypothetical protein